MYYLSRNLYQVVCSVQLQVKGLNQYERNHDLILTPYLEMIINHSLTLISVIHVCVKHTSVEATYLSLIF